LSGAGKSTIADVIEKKLLASGRHTMLLDGDNVRHGLQSRSRFYPTPTASKTSDGREVAKLMTEAGLIVICSFHFTVPRRASDGAGVDRSLPLSRDICGHTARRMHPARSKGLYSQ